jgi:hypothetical protein
MLFNDVEVIDVTREQITFVEMRQMLGWSFGDEGRLIADLWDAFNERHWDGRLVPVPLFFPRVTTYGHWLGLYTCNAANESIHIQLKFQLTTKQKADVLLHEMVHQFLAECGQNPKHNGIPWCNEIMRLTKEIWGVEIHASPSVPRKKDGRSVRIQKPSAIGQESISRPQIAAWPCSIGLSVPFDSYLTTCNWR